MKMQKINFYKRNLWLILYAMLFQNGISWAATPKSTADVILKGTVVIPPCDVNSNAPIDIDFGNIPVTGPAGGGVDQTYRQVKTIPVTCTWYQGTPYVKITGTLWGGTAACIATSINGLCIDMYQGDAGQPMFAGEGANGNGYPIEQGFIGGGSASGSFTFSAAPWWDAAIATAPGSFTASATMSIIYN